MFTGRATPAAALPPLTTEVRPRARPALPSPPLPLRPGPARPRYSGPGAPLREGGRCAVAAGWALVACRWAACQRAGSASAPRLLPPMHRHDTDTQSLQLPLSPGQSGGGGEQPSAGTGALPAVGGETRRGQPGTGRGKAGSGEGAGGKEGRKEGRKGRGQPGTPSRRRHRAAARSEPGRSAAPSGR